MRNSLLRYSPHLRFFFSDDAAAGGGAGDAGTGTGSSTGAAGDGGQDLGFPKDTPLAEMTSEQQVAYWKHKARKHENVANSRADYDELKTAKAELDRIKREGLSDQDKALADAREEGRQAALAEAKPRLVEAAFRAKAAKLPDVQVDALWAGLNPSAFLDSDGEVDTDKVANYVAQIVPAEDPRSGLYNTGQGDREPIKQTAREAGQAEAQKRFGTKSN